MGMGAQLCNAHSAGPAQQKGWSPPSYPLLCKCVSGD